MTNYREILRLHTGSMPCSLFCSQFDIPGWPEKLSDPLLADAICDRMVHDAYTIFIGGKESMHKRKGLQDI